METFGHLIDSKTHQSNLTEQRVIAHLLESNKYHVSTFIGSKAPIDIVAADPPGRILWRISVKSTVCLKDGYYQVSIADRRVNRTKTNVKPFDKKSCDIVAAVCVLNDLRGFMHIAYIPSSLINTTTSLRIKLGHKPNHLSKGFYLEDFKDPEVILQ